MAQTYQQTDLRTFQDPGINWQSNSVILALIGGILVGVITATRHLLLGKITGISGFLSRTVNIRFKSVSLKARLTQNLLYVVGLVCGGAIARRYLPDCFEDWSSLPTARLVMGGILVGVGTTMGNGCTSGHGICGISSFRIRGVVATSTFMLSSIVTALAANTSSYLPFFENTLPVERGGAVVGVCIAVCLVMSVVSYVFRSQLEADTIVNTAIKCLIDGVSGIIFALAMAVSNMTKLSATISFLDLRYWNPSLAFVMGGGIFVTSLSFLATTRFFDKPLLESKFHKPDFIYADWKLVIGACIFGVGWVCVARAPARH